MAPVLLRPVPRAGVKQSHWADTTVPPHQVPSAGVSNAGGTGAEHDVHREATMANQPTQAEISDFLDGLRRYRESIPARQQQMLDVMVVGTLNNRDGAAAGDDVQTFWAAVNPVGPVGGIGAGGVAVNPYGPAGGPGAGAVVW